MRYFIRLSYLGTDFFGWQRQPNASTVQQTLEEVLSKILQKNISITGCGRTDTGVHAQNYFAHFDCETPLPKTLVMGANALLPASVAIHEIFEVAPTAHARFDAVERQYHFRIIFEKDPFQQHTAWHFPQAKKVNFAAMQAFGALLPEYRDFFTFCKTHSGLENFECDLKFAEWQEIPNGWVFHIAANRFLRGMVRLIVGASIQLGTGKISLTEIQNALETRQILQKNLSVPPQGLTLSKVIYPTASTQPLP